MSADTGEPVLPGGGGLVPRCHCQPWSPNLLHVYKVARDTWSRSSLRTSLACMRRLCAPVSWLVPTYAMLHQWPTWTSLVGLLETCGSTSDQVTHTSSLVQITWVTEVTRPEPRSNHLRYREYISHIFKQGYAGFFAENRAIFLPPTPSQGVDIFCHPVKKRPLPKWM